MRNPCPFAFLTTAVLGAALPAFANLSYVCDTASFAANAPANTCDALNGSSVSGVYGSTFNNVNANIFIQFSGGGVASSNLPITQVAYSDYYAALASHTDNATALASLSAISDPLETFGNTNDIIDITPALASALGLTVNGASTAGITSAGGSCTLGVDSDCYYGVITMAANPSFYYYPVLPTDPSGGAPFDFYYLVMHETDEILGTISCIGGDNVDACNPGGADAAAADLFRYASANTRSFLTTSNGTLAYFSNDGGLTNIAEYTNTPGFGDYGDWASVGPNKVQTGEASPGYFDIKTDGGSEIAVLNAVGFNLVPEPGTWTLIGLGLVALGCASDRRKRLSHRMLKKSWPLLIQNTD